MPETNTNGCKCQFTGNEPSPTSKGLCPQCHPKGYRAHGPRESIWVIKTRSDGTNYWANVHAPELALFAQRTGSRRKAVKVLADHQESRRGSQRTNIRKDGEYIRSARNDVWKCTNCVKSVPTKVCVGGVCKVPSDGQLTKARFYELLDADVVKAITMSSATYGDIISNKEETYIVSKSGAPEKLTIDSSSQFIIPDTYLNDLDIFYWDNIAEEADLGYQYTKKHFEELQEKLYKGEIHLRELLREYGTVIVTA